MDDFKVNRKSIRLTDKVCKYIESYRGDNFNAQLENLVLDFEERRDELVLEWNKLDAMIKDKHQEMMRLQEQLRKARVVDARFGPLVEALVQLFPKEVY